MQLKMPEIAMPDVHMPDVHMPDVNVSEIKQAATKAATHAATLAAKFLADEVAKARSFDPIRFAGYQRRPSALYTVLSTAGLIVAGAAVGAGVVLLVSPGAEDTRKSIKRSVSKLFGIPESKEDTNAKSDDNKTDVKADANSNDANAEDRSQVDGHDEEFNQAILSDGHARRAPRAPMPSKTHD